MDYRDARKTDTTYTALGSWIIHPHNLWNHLIPDVNGLARLAFDIESINSIRTRRLRITNIHTAPTHMLKLAPNRRIRCVLLKRFRFHDKLSVYVLYIIVSVLQRSVITRFAVGHITYVDENPEKERRYGLCNLYTYIK